MAGIKTVFSVVVMSWSPFTVFLLYVTALGLCVPTHSISAPAQHCLIKNLSRCGRNYLLALRMSHGVWFTDNSGSSR